MSKRTVLNDNYKGLVEQFSIPVELHSRKDGRPYASSGSVVPLHCCSEEEKKQRAATTHHYCDVFSDRELAPLAELAYVRLDEAHAEKVFVNRTKRILLVSADGSVAQWRAAATFESSNQYMAGAPIVDQHGALISVVTARRGNHYAVSTFDGEGGYFETAQPWSVLQLKEGEVAYGDRVFPDRESLRAHLAGRPPTPQGDLPQRKPVLFVAAAGNSPRLALVQGEKQLAHYYLHAVAADNVDYL